jgi:predicted enzyme related to lactoylglutathione lyase
MTSDPERSRSFYSRLFGWKPDEPAEEFGGYFTFNLGGLPVAGCMPSRPGMPDVWSVYLATDDAGRTVDAAAANGGQVHIQPMAVADLGTMAGVIDPGGGWVGVWQPGVHPGFRTIGETGAPSWFELQTRDYDAAVDFYRKVFGWETHVMSDSAEMRYTTLAHGDTWLAGVMDASPHLPEGAPAQWSVYFGVDDADAALATVVELGGSVFLAAEDTPYGRLAGAVDATGARFKLVAPNAAMPGN